MAPLKPGAKVCSVCGNKIKVKNITCPQCGNLEPEGTEKCGICGCTLPPSMEEEIAKAEAEKMQENVPAEEEENKPSSGDMESTGEADISIIEAMVAEDEKPHDYPTMDAVEMPGQKKKKDSQEKASHKDDIPLPMPTVIGKETSSSANSGGGGNNNNTYQGFSDNSFSSSNFYKPNFPTRNIAVCVILSLLTCGIYGLYWFVKLTDETNMISSKPTASGVPAILLILFTCGIYGIYWAYQKGKAIDEYNLSSGKGSSNNSVLYLVLTLFGLEIVAYCLMQNELNNM